MISDSIWTRRHCLLSLDHYTDGSILPRERPRTTPGQLVAQKVEQQRRSGAPAAHEEDALPGGARLEVVAQNSDLPVVPETK